MKRLIVTGLAVIASLTVAAPASALITLDGYQSLQVGQTRWHVAKVADDRGCFVRADLHAGQIYLRKIYKTDTGPTWVIVDYVKTDDTSPFRLVNKSLTNDLQLSGITSYTCSN